MRLDLEFSRPHASFRTLILPALGLLALLFSLAQWQAARETRQALEADVAALQNRPAAPGTAPALPPTRQAAQASIAALLDAPWQPALGAIEAARDPRIALLAVDAQQAGRQIKLMAEARSLSDALDFVEALEARPEIVRASLTQHEIRSDSPYAPVRFHVALEWQA
ncbi:MAG: hypothetical protein B7Y26_07880 [Hydrogenophilales bacterium 16-64-46]|nr:MAG: hypothetical protein B7Z32_08420 [Hydrogenophilales bacterium 12-64-13]OYZ05661.1 MAG: hypothetical protein B7Y26_07880 [Hydrogenophilales bacterium 16-64-46]OZA40240.1 MAG: hypothetical protein B7X87_01260 [Hydrogenophilales bacterium 17-64-34]HQT00790.1 hypothetical protein [Thiobacillus sp.]